MTNASRLTGWLGAALLCACVIEDKGVGVEDTDDAATTTSGSETTGSSSATGSATTSATSETGTGEVTGEVTGTTRDETDAGSGEVTTGGTESTSESTGGGDEVRCGELVCTDGDVCIETVFPPECVPLEEGEMCPPDQEQSQCGGIGFACCCDPPPPSELRCAAPVGCEDDEVASCECLEGVCAEGFECVAHGDDPDHRFVCQTLPVP